MGVEFTGNNGEGLSGSMPAEIRSGGLTSGGPLESPKGSDQGMSASGDIVNFVGPENVSGGDVQFVGSDW